MKVYDINHANYVQPVGKVPTNNSTLALTNASMLIKTEPLEGENICMDLAAVCPNYSSTLFLSPLLLSLCLLLFGLGSHLLHLDGIGLASAHVEIVVTHAQGQDTLVDA